MRFQEVLGALIRSSDFRRNWLPMTGNYKNFSTQFTFTPESLKQRAKHRVAKECRGPYRHPFTLAYEFQELLEAGVVNNRAEIARVYGLSRARVTQVMKLLDLAEKVQEYIARPLVLPPAGSQSDLIDQCWPAGHTRWEALLTSSHNTSRCTSGILRPRPAVPRLSFWAIQGQQ